MDLSRHLAANLRTLRGRAGLTQQALAERAGLPRSTLANLETGSGNPTLAVLGALGIALQVRIDELLSAPTGLGRYYPPGSLPVDRRGRARVFQLLPDALPGTEISRMEIPPGARIRGVPHLPGTREYMHTEAGCVDLRVGGEAFEVPAGGVCTFRGDLPHSYAALGSEPAVVYGIVVLAPLT